MLTHIDIKNFVLIDHLALDLNAGLTVITGETGAGKSIIMDAIELALGQRADSMTVRQGTEQCEITLLFSVNTHSPAYEWLSAHDLASDDECIIRRVISNDGRSRASINNVPCPLQQIKDLAALLINIHGQHQHQALLKRSYQRQLLDAYANHPTLTHKVTTLYEAWHKTHTELSSILNNQQDHTAEIALLTDQIAELEACELQADTYELLDLEHRQLAAVDTQLIQLNQAYQLLSQQDDSNLLEKLFAIEQALQEQSKLLPQLNNVLGMLMNASVLLQETNSEIEHLLSSLEPNPERLFQVEKRLEKIHHLARKHRIKATELHSLQATLQERLHALVNSEARVAELQGELEKLNADYQIVASQLSASREKVALKLSKAITAQMQELSLGGGELKIDVQAQHNTMPRADGQDNIELLVRTNPSQPLNALSKVVSGGELSRISLAIHVTTGEQMTIPTQIFDEVDVGIGGPTATIVGKLLRQLGTQSQILCITHLPQVAANGHHHLFVSKNTHKKSALTKITALTREARAQELARMLGDLTVTANAIAHAENLLANAEVA
jgi:DNA repair protein RecN (Recombination protein N)